MHAQHRAGVAIDVCSDCGMVWFDAEELDRCLEDAVPAGDPPDEADIPDRGPSTRRCPRCAVLLRCAGWTDAVIDRCRQCRGLLVGARELRTLAVMPDPSGERRFESLRDQAIAAGWTVLAAKGWLFLLLRVLARS